MLPEGDLSRFRKFMATAEASGKLPIPRVEGAFDTRRYGRDGGYLETPTEPKRHTTPEEAGRDNDLDLRRHMANGVRRLSRDQHDLLLDLLHEGAGSDQERERIKDVLGNVLEQGEDEDPPEQTSIEGSLLKGDPDPHLRASAGDRRKAMDSIQSLRARWQRGELSERDYVELSNRFRRYGSRTPSGRDIESCNRLYGPPPRQAY
jgi:hypothetical protein